MKTYVIVILSISVSLVIGGVIAALFYYMQPSKPRLPCNQMSFEYRDETSNYPISLPAEIKNAYCISIPLQENKKFKISGKACSSYGICDNIEIKSTPAYNITYTDKLFNGSINEA